MRHTLWCIGVWSAISGIALEEMLSLAVTTERDVSANGATTGQGDPTRFAGCGSADRDADQSDHSAPVIWSVGVPHDPAAVESRSRHEEIAAWRSWLVGSIAAVSRVFVPLTLRPADQAVSQQPRAALFHCNPPLLL
ncbi:MAG: hypothetical protein WD066_17830 [Planctomycetaceae bacterium]